MLNRKSAVEMFLNSERYKCGVNLSILFTRFFKDDMYNLTKTA